MYSDGKIDVYTLRSEATSENLPLLEAIFFFFYMTHNHTYIYMYMHIFMQIIL